MADLKLHAGELAGKDGKFTILHKLNQQAGKWYLDAKWFEQNLKDWENVPVIFAKDHPKTRAREDLKAALESCNGKLMGFPSNVQIEKTGHPKLTANIPINDAVAESYYQRGLLSPSTGWDSPDDGSNLTGPVKPDHILLFPEDDAHQPGDRAAMMFQAPIPEHLAEIKSWMSKIWDKIQGKEEPGAKPMNDDEIKTFKAEMEKKLADSDQKIKVFEAENADLKKKLEESEKNHKEFLAKLEQDRKDNTWKTYLATAKIPKGWIDKPEKEAEQRKEFEADPAAYTVRVLKFHEQQNPAGAPAGGQGQDQAPQDDGLLPKVKTIGVWNEAKQIYE